MPATFNISTGNPVVFTRPSITVAFTDTTPALCGVSAWEWKYNNTIVSTSNSWSHVFFSSQSSPITLTVQTSTIGSLSSDPVTFIIEPAWPTYPSFRILPANEFAFTPNVGVASITAQNTSPQLMTGIQTVSSLTYLSGMVLGVPQITGQNVSVWTEVVQASASAFQWYFNEVPVATTRDWSYQFFDSIEGSVSTDMYSMAFSGLVTTTNGTEFSGVSSIWQSLSSVDSYTETPGLCSLAAQTLVINDATQFATCSAFESVTPVGIRASTTLNPVVTSYELLSERIKMQLGWPMTNIEICEDQIMDFISQGCEWFSKYSGFTEEFLVFDSNIYQCGYGIKVDHILNHISDFYCPYSAAGPMVSGQYVDCDLNNYRKVAGIFSCDPAGGSGSGSETLFNMDYLFAQQAYFGQMLGGTGYDVTTWHLLKEWMDLRKKMFAIDIYVNFNPQTQMIRLTPEPHVRRGRYIGVIGCHMEKCVRELVQERWVQKYALALTKISLGHIRGKFGQVTLFGGGTVNATDIMTQGLEEKNKLEEEIMTFGAEQEPPMFFIE